MNNYLTAKISIVSILLTMWTLLASAQSQQKLVYTFPIHENIMPSTATLTSKCLRQATEMGADVVIIDMNTYGGVLDAADSIRTMLLRYPKPVITFINNQAASAGALIAISTDRIYMARGASIGAASVVNQNGEVMPDKYQSFMRSMMRSTAEAHGKRIEVNGSDTAWVWHRDPMIAEAMVDPTVTVDGLVDSSKVLTFTVEEAIRNGYCEGAAESIDEILKAEGVSDYTVYEYQPTTLDRILGFLTNPAIQGIFIMLIIGGIYFELQTPGIGFALVVSILAAALYFAPLYLQGMLDNWELILFIVGIVLILLEIFVVPGFGITGIAGICAIVVGLTFALIDTDLLHYIPTGELSIGIILKPLFLVIISVSAAFVASFLLAKRFLEGKSELRNRLVLVSDMSPEQGYVSRERSRNFSGHRATALTDLHPSGKIEIDGKIYEAAGEDALFVEKGNSVIVVRDEGGVLYVKPE